ncbi:hypothetical protein LZZ90_08425 [Flavobacterium sp. SM15]|uniref:hypothetical protein n=1 Tax=Flavobacterium sp. SM15 TaxID=2908005 RepID=UPI001EDB71BE|nr:hypothetical protein [Flavobacterium sp. SM15]MCG2611532.1 hypothetical protein [Flavobacterium sp. SM15]
MEYLFIMEEEALYNLIGKEIPGAEQSQMFGKPCFKINGKAFVCFFQKEMVFKLNGDFHSEALNLEGAHLFDPSGKGRAMKEWVQLPYRHSDKWNIFAVHALHYVQNSTK